MYHVQYLSSLCQRRRWPDPFYQSFDTGSGYACVVRVNNREYQTDTVYASELLAREHAAMCAYYICRDFSVNDGRYPAGQQTRSTVIQGLPVAIGAGRRAATYREDVISESGSGGSSPGGSDDGRLRAAQPYPKSGRRHEKQHSKQLYY